MHTSCSASHIAIYIIILHILSLVIAVNTIISESLSEYGRV